MGKVVGSGNLASANGAWRSRQEQELIDFVDACDPGADGQGVGVSSSPNGFLDTSPRGAEGE